MDAVTQLGASLIVMGLVLLAGRVIRIKVRPIQALFLPTSVVAGVLALLIGPQVLGALVERFVGETAWFAGGIIPQWVLDGWDPLPKLLINVVFAGLLLGKTLPSAKAIWQKSGPQVLFGYTLAFGQYALGFLLVLLVLGPVFGVDEKAGALIEIAFTGGHGTAAGLEPTFIEVGYEEGRDLALGLATIGVVMGVILGTLFVNIAVRSDRITIAREEPVEAEEDYDIDQLTRNDAPEPQQDDAAADPLTKHLALIGVAIALGWLLKQGLVLLERFTWGAWADTTLMELIPLFPLAMIGGVILQAAMVWAGHDGLIQRDIINRIGGAALDIIIVAAMATISLEALGANLPAFLILGAAGIAWCVAAFWLLAPRMLPYRWFERGIGDMGQSSGMAVTGLLLIRVSDPRNQTGAIESFGYKQLLFEPLVGGGLFTALSVPLTARFGAPIMLLVSGAVTLAALITGMVMARRIS